MPVIRREVPLLEPTQRIEVKRVITARSYPFGRAEPLRITRGEPFPVSVLIDPAFAKTCLMTFITTVDQSYPEQMRIKECENDGSGKFTCVFLPTHTGVFVFRARYSLDDGKNWLFDDIPYTWLIVDPPAVNDLRLYSFIPTASGHIGQWKRELERIKQLGCNAVHLLPLTHLDISESPYSAHDLFSLDPSYLDPADSRDSLTQWEDFVEHAKQLEMRLCLDLVLNHIGAKSRIAKLRPEWIVRDPTRPDGFKRAGCWHGQSWIHWEDLLLLNYDHPNESERDALWTYMSQYAMFWANYAAYTNGMVRFDNLHSSNPDFVTTLTRLLRATYPDLILFAEFFSDEGTIVKRMIEWEIDILLATPWDYKFVPELRRYLKYLHQISGQVRYLVPVSSHDSGPPAKEFGSPLSTQPRYAISALLSFGATGLSQGTESGIREKINFIGRNRSLPSAQGDGFSTFIEKINEIQREHRVFHLSRNCTFVDRDHEAIIAALRWDPSAPRERYLVAANFDIMKGYQFEIDFSSYITGRKQMAVRNLLADAPSSTMVSPNLHLQFAPCEVKVLLIS